MSDHALLTAILRQDPSSFIQRSFQTVSPGNVYRHNWHIDAIAWALRQCLNGEIRRLVITLPPRSLKSIAVSVALPAYVLGLDPRQKTVCVSYSQELANKHARDCRAVMETDWYRRAFPRTRIAAEKNTQAEFMTTRRGYRLATSVLGTLVGRGGNILILDDVHKPDEAQSEVLRTRVIDWYRSSLATRLDDKTRDVTILIQQRVHEEDLAGVLLEQGGWHHLNLPAIAEEAQAIPLGRHLVHLREKGEVLHPEREPYEALMRLKAEMGSYDFAAQYQQSPAPRGGGIVKWDWFQRYDVAPEKGTGDRIVQSWDTASKSAETNDYSVCTTWLMREKRYFLLHVLRRRLEYPNLIYPEKEHEIHEGRKRIDIAYTNNSDAGFFLRRRQDARVAAIKVYVECKNYMQEMANPELDQLAGRFSVVRGRLGFLIGRNFDNRERFIDRCRDTARDDRGFIVALVDEDIVRMLEMIETERRWEIDRYLERRFDELLE